ncbi:putative zinc transport system ATP-binding protein AdcC [Sedimentisphaera cyanobacteriorum]|uniref:Putative zinc transport system ATP-binding protein AdcC n=1 Tax=Sedimentisphaera cyanobacteriorum TaxID=1940790 RepID=A0A1Q2HQZ6_9BACT|nr:ABC transporter ATP-binding protein [Sedimentisphaera cyanobacteriorum]AQQ09663.1 putative zinc transport system ATP-binding protein AdcC [Sedimentisphaera cyanobacteriorum]
MGAELKISNLSIRASGREILKDINLSICPGEYVNIIGANGAGKTTLLKAAAGLKRPASGKISFDGQDIYGLGWWKKTNLQKRIGYIPQSAEYNSELPFTAGEVAAMGRVSARRLFERLKSEDQACVDEWLGKLHIKELKNQPFSSLSGGEKQKVLIARALTQNPSLLILDEPSANLDFYWKKEISRLVKDLQKALGITVVMVSHEISAIPQDSDKTILLREGALAGQGSSEKVLASEEFEKAYGRRLRLSDSQADGFFEFPGFKAED